MSEATLAWATLRVAGEDARTYLDGQISQSVDVAESGAWTLVLEPSGEVVTSGWLRVSEGEAQLLVPALLAARTHARLNRFLLRTRCRIDVADGAVDPPMATLDDLETTQWPWANELDRGLTPHSYGATFVAATVSFTKGCFTGQELVGRMDARGASTPWRFVHASASSLEQIATALDVGPAGPKGITTVFAGPPQCRVHAIAHRSVLGRDLDDSTIVISEIS